MISNIKSFSLIIKIKLNKIKIKIKYFLKEIQKYFSHTMFKYIIEHLNIIL